MIGTLRLHIKRFKNRFKYLFNLRSLLWEYESCADCGHCFRLAWQIKDGIWESVVGDPDGGSLCLDCFIERAEQRGVQIVKSDFEWLAVFSELGTDAIISER